TPNFSTRSFNCSTTGLPALLHFRASDLEIAGVAPVVGLTGRARPRASGIGKSSSVWTLTLPASHRASRSKARLLLGAAHERPKPRFGRWHPRNLVNQLIDWIAIVGENEVLRLREVVGHGGTLRAKINGLLGVDRHRSVQYVDFVC